MFPVQSDLFSVKVGTLFRNDDNGLRHFSGFVLSVPTFFRRAPEADQAETHAEAVGRPAGLELGAWVAGQVPPLTGPSGALRMRGVEIARKL